MLKIATWTGRSNERNDLNVCIGPPTCPPARAHLDAIRAGDREETILIHCIILCGLLQRVAGAAANDHAGLVVSVDPATERLRAQGRRHGSGASRIASPRTLTARTGLTIGPRACRLPRLRTSTVRPSAPSTTGVYPQKSGGGRRSGCRPAR